MEVGTRDLASLQRVVFRYDEALSTTLDFDETGLGRRALGVTGRFAKLVLVDAPLVFFITSTVQHEVFGHGARARESGQWPTYSFGLPYPYATLLAPSQRYSGFAHYSDTGIADRDLLVTAGGIESNVFYVTVRGTAS